MTMVCEKTEINGEFTVACEWDPCSSFLGSPEAFPLRPCPLC